MALFLQIIGGVVLTIFLLIVGIFFYLKIKFGKWGQLDNTSSQTPLSIHLNEDLSPDWLEKPEASSILADFKTLGFYHGKAYIVHEMDGVMLQSLFFGDYAAAVYNHPQAGFWSDVAFQAQDGKFLMATNAPMGEEIESHPDNIKIYKADANAIELYNIVKQETQNQLADRIKDENFRDIFENTYKRDMCWRNNRGGITIEEFKKNWKSANSKIKLTKDNLRRVFLELKVDELHQWHHACIEEFRKHSEFDYSQFEDMEFDLFIVPQKTISNAFIEYLADFDIVQESMKEKLINALRKQTNIPKIFELINNSFSSDLRAQYVGKVEFPLHAQIYKRSEKLSG